MRQLGHSRCMPITPGSIHVTGELCEISCKTRLSILGNAFPSILGDQVNAVPVSSVDIKGQQGTTRFLALNTFQC